MKTSSLLPPAEKSQSIIPSHLTFNSGQQQHTTLPAPPRLLLYGCQPLEIWEMQLRVASSLKASRCFYKCEICTRQEQRISYKQILPMVFFWKLKSLGLLHICIWREGITKKSIAADCTNVRFSDHTDTHRQVKLPRTKITS